MCLVSSRISENPPKSLWRQGRPAGGRIHSAFDRAAPLHPRPWRRSYGGAATGCTPCMFDTLPKCKHSALWGKIRILVRAAGFFCWLVHPRGPQEPQKLKHQNVRKSSLISPPLSAGIRELSDTHTHTKGYFELLRHGRMCGPKGGFTELTCMKWQDRQREQITIAALCSLPAFPN